MSAGAYLNRHPYISRPALPSNDSYLPHALGPVMRLIYYSHKL